MKCKDCNWCEPLDDKQGTCRGRSPGVAAIVMPVQNPISLEVTPQIMEMGMFPKVLLEGKRCGRDFAPKGIPSEVLN